MHRGGEGWGKWKEVEEGGWPNELLRGRDRVQAWTGLFPARLRGLDCCSPRW